MKTVKTLILLGSLALCGTAIGQMLPDKRADVTPQVKAHFAMLDANKDGAITRDEMAAMHDRQKAAMRDQHFKSMDTNNDGMISRAEFDVAHQDGGDGERHKMGGEHDGPGKMDMDHGKKPMMDGGKMMEMADANKDGKLTEAELLLAALARFDAADANKDGLLTQAERIAGHGMKGEGHREGKGGKRR